MGHAKRRLTAQFCQFEIRKKFARDSTNRAIRPNQHNKMSSEKKRKRREENGERPKKKVAMAPKGNVQVQLLENKDTLGPLLGTRTQQSHGSERA